MYIQTNLTYVDHVNEEKEAKAYICIQIPYTL